jgi:hypothetical protein
MYTRLRYTATSNPLSYYTNIKAPVKGLFLWNINITKFVMLNRVKNLLRNAKPLYRAKKICSLSL